MEIHALAKGHIEENELLRKENVSNTVSSNSIDWIKRRLPLYPDYYSMLWYIKLKQKTKIQGFDFTECSKQTKISTILSYAWMIHLLLKN